MEASPAKRRIALFTHDSHGLGHVRRSVNILRAVATRDPSVSSLLITGSPATADLARLPRGADVLKIPTIVTSGDEATRPPTLGLGVAELASLRGHIVRETLVAFEPDVFLVDNFPLGTRLELLPALREMRHRPTRTVLGLRDVVDPPEKVRKDWARDGLFDIVERYYDRILVYGSRDILDATESYGLSEATADKLHYCGYVTPETGSLAPETVRRERGLADGFLLATVGGGGDGLPLLATFLEAATQFPEREALVIAGELMGAADRASLAERCASVPGARMLDHVADLPSVMSAAGAVVAMAGYNTSAEIVASGARAVLVPRSWRAGEHGNRGATGTDAEQLVRARGLAKLGLVELVEPQDLTAGTLAQALRRVLDRAAPASSKLPLDGAARVAAHLLEI